MTLSQRQADFVAAALALDEGDFSRLEKELKNIRSGYAAGKMFKVIVDLESTAHLTAGQKLMMDAHGWIDGGKTYVHELHVVDAPNSNTVEIEQHEFSLLIKDGKIRPLD